MIMATSRAKHPTPDKDRSRCTSVDRLKWAAAVASARLPATCYRVAAWMAWMTADSTGIFWGSKGTLASSSGVSMRRIYGAFSALEAAGFIRKGELGGSIGRMTYRWTLVIPPDRVTGGDILSGGDRVSGAPPDRVSGAPPDSNDKNPLTDCQDNARSNARSNASSGGGVGEPIQEHKTENPKAPTIGPHDLASIYRSSVKGKAEDIVSAFALLSRKYGTDMMDACMQTLGEAVWVNELGDIAATYHAETTQDTVCGFTGKVLRPAKVWAK